MGVLLFVLGACGKTDGPLNYNDEFPKFESKEKRLGSPDYSYQNELERVVMEKIAKRRKDSVLSEQLRKYYVDRFHEFYEAQKKYYIEQVKEGKMSKEMAEKELEINRFGMVCTRYELETKAMFAEAFSYEILDSEFIGEDRGVVKLRIKKLKGIDLKEFQEKLEPLSKKAEEIMEKRKAITGGFRVPLAEREKLVAVEREGQKIREEILKVYHEFYIKNHIKNPSYETKEITVELKRNSYNGEYEIESSYQLLHELDSDETSIFKSI